MYVYVWGFTPEELYTWPADLEPIAATAWPTEEVLVVSGHAVEAFQQALSTDPLPDGRLPAAILYLPANVSVPREAWMYFDAQVAAGDWQALRALLACPTEVRLSELAHEVPASWLEQLTQPLETLTPDDVPLTADFRQTLKVHPTGWAAFLRTLRTRLEVRDRLLPADPSSKRVENA